MNTAPTNLAAYLDEAVLKIAKQLKWARWRIVIFNLVYPPVSIVLFAGIALHDTALFLVAVLCFSPTLLILGFQRLSYKKKIETLGELAPLPATSVLYQIIDDARKSLVPQLSTIDVKLSLVSEIGASVYQSASSAIMVVTLGLAQLTSQYPDRAKGIVYHEVAHLLHNDTELFDFTIWVARGIKTYILVMVGIGGAIFLFDVLFVSGWHSPIKGGFGLVAMLWTMQSIDQIEQVRLRSELCADLRAATYIGPGPVADAILHCLKPEIQRAFGKENLGHLSPSLNGWVHPHRDQRLFALECLREGGEALLLQKIGAEG